MMSVTGDKNVYDVTTKYELNSIDDVLDVKAKDLLQELQRRDYGIVNLGRTIIFFYKSV